ncbi:MAG: signal peptide peptidase SppA [Tannerellaceae bacterium]|jgi:protease-4|nr:signal peptide peptidase SppA [Tannerellaceae bacterium]
MKQFFKMTFASALGGLVAMGAVILIGSFILIGMAATLGNKPDYVPKTNTVFKLSLNGFLQETAEENPFEFLSFGEMVTPLSIKDIRKAIRVAKENPHIKGIYLEAGSLTAGTASLDIVRRALLDFKTGGKFIVAYGDNYTQGAYYLCSVADKVFLNPLGLVDIHGLVSETTFYKGILHKLGVEIEVFKVGTYKGAVEPYLLDKLSDDNRAQITSYQQSIWTNIVNDIAQSRNLTPQDINNFANQGYAISAAEKTVEFGLVDELKYKTEAEEYAKELAGQTDDKLKTAGLNRIKTIKETAPSTGKNDIAILYAEGEIMTEGVSSFYGSKLITEDMAGQLDKLRKDENVKAVVFRVNSPGGSAYVSEQIWKAVTELKKVKPIVVSMGNVAASGGYYIACAASKIIAEPNTLTGSIGIFGIIPNTTDLYKKLDITTDIVQTNTYGDILNPTRPLRADEKAIMQAHIEYMYNIFLSRCADGRGKTKEEIDQIGQGRVWTGQQALEIDLVDALGGIDEAVTAAAQLAELTDYRITHVSDTKDFFQSFLEKQLEDIKLSFVKSVIGDEYKYLKMLNEVKHRTGVQARLLYDIQPL